MRKSTQRERRLSFAEITKDLSASAEAQMTLQVSSDSKQREEKWTPSSGVGQRELDLALHLTAGQTSKKGEGLQGLELAKIQNKMEFSPIRFLSPSPT